MLFESRTARGAWQSRVVNTSPSDDAVGRVDATFPPRGITCGGLLGGSMLFGRSRGCEINHSLVSSIILLEWSRTRRGGASLCNCAFNQNWMIVFTWFIYRMRVTRGQHSNVPPSPMCFSEYRYSLAKFLLCLLKLGTFCNCCKFRDSNPFLSSVTSERYNS